MEGRGRKMSVPASQYQTEPSLSKRCVLMWFFYMGWSIIHHNVDLLSSLSVMHVSYKSPFTETYTSTFASNHWQTDDCIVSCVTLLIYGKRAELQTFCCSLNVVSAWAWDMLHIE